MNINVRYLIGLLVIIFVLALSYGTISNYIEEYKTVSEVVTENTTQMTWVNGTIQKGSFISLNTGEYIFVITDGISFMNVSFTGELPPSLSTESNIVIFGTFKNSSFHASKMITKCPTKYNG